jgi:hypothetical protein
MAQKQAEKYIHTDTWDFIDPQGHAYTIITIERVSDNTSFDVAFKDTGLTYIMDNEGQGRENPTKEEESAILSVANDIWKNKR